MITPAVAVRLSRPHAAAAGVLAAVGLNQLLDPTRRDIPLCPFHAITGWWCPLCGGLRAAYSLTRLDLSAALRDNVLLVAGLPIVIALWLDWAVRTQRGEAARQWPKGALAGLWLVALAFVLVRNSPLGESVRPA